MIKASLKDMVGGWFVGDFTPSLMKQGDFEVAVKYYREGDCEPLHEHRLAREITVIVKGRVIMCGSVFVEGDIIILEPGESTSFEALSDVITVVVKSPSIPGDKYLL